jgi:serine/threonine-protein kinase RsbW
MMVRAGYGERDIFGVRLSLEEAVVNAIRHGHRGDTSKAVAVRFFVDAAQVFAEVADEGPGFDPALVPDPLAPENLERPSGRGVFLMRHYMTSVQFNERGNCVTLCKQKSDVR